MTATLLDRLRTLVGAANVLTGLDLPPYAIEGRTPEAAVFPGSPEEVRAVVEALAQAEVPVVPWGGGTAVSVGTPVTSGGVVMGLRRLARLLEHEPGDLTATVEAGMTIGALQEAVGARGQWLSLDPGEPGRATVGGVVAADGSGPRRHLYGTPRDLVIGVTVVTGEGRVVRGGGKVVKNVAGYDLPKLFVGSRGTLGVIVEVTVKLRPRPDEERLVAVRFDRLKDAGAAVRALAGSDLVPNAVELVDAEVARPLGLDPAPALVVGFDGLAEQVAWQCEELGRLTACLGGRGLRTLPAETWGHLTRAVHEVHRTPAAIMRLVVLPTLVAETMEQGAAAARQRGLPSAWSAHAGVGVVTAALSAPGEATALSAVAAVLAEWRGVAHAGGGHAVLEWAPLAIKAEVPVWDEPGGAGRIMRRIKEQLDPRNVLNPGRFVEGI